MRLEDGVRRSWGEGVVCESAVLKGGGGGGGGCGKCVVRWGLCWG